MARQESFEWTPERHARLKELWLKGYSADEVKFMLRATSRSAVMSQVAKLGLQRRPPTKNKKSFDGRNNRYVKAQKVARYKETKGEAFGEPTKLIDLTDKQCHYPIGDPKHDGFHFCGAEKESGKSYCQSHHILCHAPKIIKETDRNEL